MKNRCRGPILLALVVLPLAGGCASAARSSPPQLPPESPLPASSFSVEFVPAGAERYPPTDTKDVVRFKNLLHWPGQPDQVRGDQLPTRT